MVRLDSNIMSTTPLREPRSILHAIIGIILCAFLQFLVLILRIIGTVVAVPLWLFGGLLGFLENLCWGEFERVTAWVEGRPVHTDTLVDPPSNNPPTPPSGMMAA